METVLKLIYWANGPLRGPTDHCLGSDKILEGVDFAILEMHGLTADHRERRQMSHFLSSPPLSQSDLEAGGSNSESLTASPPLQRNWMIEVRVRFSF